MVGSELTFDGSRVAHRAIGPGSLVASRFRLEDLLEEHSGARFWRATDLTLARNVAVHVIRRDDPRAAAVLTAARTSATVSDARILRVLDAVEEDVYVNIVHEWGSGISLDRLLPDELLEPRRAAWLVREVAEAIAVAHRQGVAHGRLLPENVLLTDVGSVKLIGFVVDGVLHGRRASGGAAPPSEHESDVLNLGALLYACLTGKWAGFPDSALPAAPYDHDRVCRPRQVRAGVPKPLDAICDQVLNPSPRGRRFETAVEVGAALSEYLGDTIGTPAVEVSEATAFLDPAALRTPEASAGLSHDGPAAAQQPARPGSGALEETQPGIPVARADIAPRGSTAMGTGQSRPSAPASPTDPAPVDDDRTRAGFAPLAATGPLPRPGAGGAPPAGWGSERRDDPPSGDPHERPGSTWWRLAAVIGVLAVVLLAVLVAPQLGGTSDDGSDDPEPTASSGPSGSTRTLQVVEPASVDDFDPDGGDAPEENADLVPLATDGKPATAWETKTYFDGPVLAPYRAGLGLLIDLGEETEVRQVSVELVSGPYDLELLAAPEGTETAPTGTEGLTTVEARSGASGEVALRGNETVRTRYLVVWLTALPRATDGYQGGIAEVVVRS